MEPFRVYLVRHAKAEKDPPPPSSPGGASGDAARRLTKGGRRRFGALLARLGPRLAVARVLSSPFVRARETAAMLAAVTGAPVEEDAAIASGASSGPQLLDLARGAGPGAALVGHNPEIAEAIAAAGGSGLAVRPGTVAAVLLDGDAARLEWLEAPDDDD